MSSTTRKGDALCRYYDTPDALADAAVARLISDGLIVCDHTILEPHAGGGAWVRALRLVSSGP